MKVSVLQYHPIFLKPEENFQRISEMIMSNATDLVVAPELCLSGYVFGDISEVQQVAESVPDGPIFTKFRELSRLHDCSIVYGFAEKETGVSSDSDLTNQHVLSDSDLTNQYVSSDSDLTNQYVSSDSDLPPSHEEKYYNSCALVNPDGSYHIYRKIHLFNAEKLYFSPGDRPFATHPAKDGVPVGLMICFDWQFPEAARSLALQGACILCHPSNLVLPWCQEAMKTRSLENRVCSITANRIGTEINGDLQEYFTGQSQILNTRGEILIRMNETETGMYTVEIDPALAANKTVTARNNAFADRRPDMYYL